MSMQSLMMALMGNQNPRRGFKDSIMEEPTEAEQFGSKHFEGEPRSQHPATFQEPDYEDEDFTPLHAALDTVNAMRDIRKRGNLGIFSPYDPSPSTRKDAGEYERLGKSLIQLSTTIPIRNRQEFETLAADLFDPSTMDSTAEGILNGMEKIISDSIKIQESKSKKGSKGKKKSTETKPNKPPITSFFK